MGHNLVGGVQRVGHNLVGAVQCVGHNRCSFACFSVLHFVTSALVRWMQEWCVLYCVRVVYLVYWKSCVPFIV